MSPSLSRALFFSSGRLSRGNIIVTDFSTTVLITAASNVDENLATLECEVAPSPSDVPLRHLLASYIGESLPRDYLDLDTEHFTPMEGALNNSDFAPSR
jgi:hypothetical protein